MRLKYFAIGALLFLVSVSVVACSPAPSSNTAPSVAAENSGPTVRARDFAPGQLEAHYGKHGAGFGLVTQQEYLERARALLNSSPGKDVLGKMRMNGDILRYRVSTGEFAVMTGAGRIRTYFRTDYRYWSRQ